MESKIMIDINYSSKEPQIFINQKESNDLENKDVRDKLISMFTGNAMPGVRDGWCRIERYPNEGKQGNTIVITPINPIDVLGHIPLMAKLAEQNQCIDTCGVREKYKKILEEELRRINSND